MDNSTMRRLTEAYINLQEARCEMEDGYYNMGQLMNKWPDYAETVLVLIKVDGDVAYEYAFFDDNWPMSRKPVLLFKNKARIDKRYCKKVGDLIDQFAKTSLSEREFTQKLKKLSSSGVKLADSDFKWDPSGVSWDKLD